MRIKRSLFDLEQSGKLSAMKAVDIKKYILSYREDKKEEATFFSFANEFVKGCNAKRTKELYEWTIKTFLNFANDEALSFAEIDKKKLEAFEVHLIKMILG